MTDHDPIIKLVFVGTQVGWEISEFGWDENDENAGSIFQLEDLQTAWEQDSRVQAATTFCIKQWDPQEGSEFDDSFQNFCKIIPQCMPNLKTLRILPHLPDAKMALVLLYLPNIPSVQLFALEQIYPLTFDKIVQLQHLSRLWLHRVDSLDDSHLAGLLQNLPNLKSVKLGHCKKGMHQTFRQIGNLQQLEDLYIQGTGGREKWLMPADFCFLADSVERLSKLRKMYLGGLCLFQPEACMEPLICAVGAHDSLQISNFIVHRVVQYTGDPEADPSAPQPNNLFQPYHWDTAHMNRTLKQGPTMDQVFEQEIRKGNLQLPQDKKYDGNLASWVEAMIAVKDIQCKGAYRWDCFHFLISQLEPELLFESPFWTNPDNQDPEERIPNFRRPVDNDEYSVDSDEELDETDSDEELDQTDSDEEVDQTDSDEEVDQTDNDEEPPHQRMRLQ